MDLRQRPCLFAHRPESGRCKTRDRQRSTACCNRGGCRGAKGQYAPERRAGSNVVVLDPDLAQAFPADEAVNKALRLVLEAAQVPEKAVL